MTEEPFKHGEEYKCLFWHGSASGLGVGYVDRA